MEVVIFEDLGSEVFIEHVFAGFAGGSDEGDVHFFEEGLEGAVFAEGAVDGGEDEVGGFEG